MTLERAKAILDYIRVTRPKRGPMMIRLSVDDIEKLCTIYILHGIKERHETNAK